ncbi:MAG: glycoside hydrolase family 3 N-terminal domain-containing protein [Candidatus Promineifilaceae bacterium]
MTIINPSPSGPTYRDPSIPISTRKNALLSQMTLEEKIGQMTLVEKNSITPEEVRRHLIGAVLSGGGGNPEDNSPAGWLEMVSSLLDAAHHTRLGIPLLYGVDAVHGHSNIRGAVIFPHNIGLGATRDADLVRRIGRATAVETFATGIRWNYAPTIAVPQDLRWGRTYEGFGERPSLVAHLGAAYIRGLQGEDLAAPFSVLATPKHYVGDGGTTWGTSTMLFPSVPSIGITERTPFIIDQGDTRLDEATFRSLHLAPYVDAVKAGAQVIMASFSSWNGQKLNAHHYLLTTVLKGELGFSGFIVTDWGSIDEVSDDNYQAVVSCINAGIDMNMVPEDYSRFMSNLRSAVDNGDVPMARIDDAVRRILTVKMKAGLFESPGVDDAYLPLIGSSEHRELACEAVAKSLVLLKNEDDVLPLAKSLPQIAVAGSWADDIGLQCGGWTIEWLGASGDITPGTSILEAIGATVSPHTVIDYDPSGRFDENGGSPTAELGLAFLGELPYAEGFGDRADLRLGEEDIALLERMRRRCNKMVVILVTGRPLILTEQLPLMDALVVAWLPGTEGQGVADVLFGDVPFTGKLPYTWPRTMDQIPLNHEKPGEEVVKPLFPFGFGLSC